MVSAGQTQAGDKSWSFRNPTGIHFGDGVRARIGDSLSATDRVAVVCTQRGRRTIQADPLYAGLLQRVGLQWVDDVETNPDIDLVQAQAEYLRASGVDTVIAIGGGSAMDTAKSLAAALGQVNGPDLRQLLADPSALRALTPLRLITVPTTAGTGSEVTPFATLWDHAAHKKLSLAGPNMFPYMAYVDPMLTLGVPEAVTVSTGLDAINQAAESIWNRNANPISLQFATRALGLGMEALPRLHRHLDDIHARRAMAECSLLAGLAISHTRTALCHSISYPLTSHFDVPHGLACAFTMKAVFSLNVAHDDGRLEKVAMALGYGDTFGMANKFAELLADLGVSDRVRRQVPSEESMLDLAHEMFTPGRADNNLAPVDGEIIRTILVESWRDAHQQRVSQ